MAKVTEKTNNNPYYNLVGWLVADSLKDIFKGKFRIEGIKYEVDAAGNEITPDKKNKETHKKMWESLKGRLVETRDKDYDYMYYPRFRVHVYDGDVFINIHSRMNIPYVINALLKESNTGELNIEIELNDIKQGNHYDFGLR